MMNIVGGLAMVSVVELQSGFVLRDATAPPPPVGTKGNGTCGGTSSGGDCNVVESGFFPNVASLDACVAKVRSCRFGTYVSWTAWDKSCSWYNDCSWDHLCVDCSKDEGPACPRPKCPQYIPFVSEVVHAAPALPIDCRDGRQCGGTNQWIAWNDTALPNSSYTNPGTMPYPRSKDLVGWEFKSGANPSYGGNGVKATSADTWFPSWGADGHLYTGFTDGVVKDDATGRYVGAQSEKRAPHDIVVTGQATIVGDDPFGLKLYNVSTFPSSTYPYYQRFPSGSLVHNGTWYYGTYWVSPYGTQPYRTTPHVAGLIDFRHSRDKGVHWIEPRFTPEGPTDSLFGEVDRTGVATSDGVKFATPHWVDFGKDMEASPDGYAYLVSHGNDASHPSSAEAWMLGNQVFLARVRPTIDAIDDRSAWEFYAGGHGASASWARGDVGRATPLIEFVNHTGCTTVTYLAPLKKYVMVISTTSTYPVLDGGNFDTWMLEADDVTGPWAYVTYMRSFGPQVYFANFVSKFSAKAPSAAAKGAPSTYEAFLMFSANYDPGRVGRTGADPPNSRYAMNLQQSRFVLSDAFAAKLARE